jgi:hypothetical protein
MSDDKAEYYRARERAERSAAEAASCPQARASHLKLAEAYALLLETNEPHQVSPARSR